MVQDIELHNSCKCTTQRKADGTCCNALTVRPLVEIMSVVLPNLTVVGKDELEYSCDALDGKDSMKFLNSFPEIACQLMGTSMAKVTAEDDADAAAETTAALGVLWKAIQHERTTNKVRGA